MSAILQPGSQEIAIPLGITCQDEVEPVVARRREAPFEVVGETGRGPHLPVLRIQRSQLFDEPCEEIQCALGSLPLRPRRAAFRPATSHRQRHQP